jgi:signal transduction histidine kinase
MINFNLDQSEAEKSTLILIVDDIPKNIQLLGNILANNGYHVAVATSGKQALSIIQKRMPDLVLLDVMMPEMDGFEVCQRIKENDSFKGIPVIFLTAKHDVDDKVRGFEVGGADYITKPFETAEVLARVQMQLQLKAARDMVVRYNQELEKIVEARTEALIRAERHAAFSLLIQGIVHNLRNPLNAISGALQLIEMEEKNAAGYLQNNGAANFPEKLTQSCEKISRFRRVAYSGVEKLMEMINSLMAKSRSDKSDALEVVDLNQLLHREIEFMKADMAFKNRVRRQIDFVDVPLMVEVVPSEIAQVFQNLLRNALDALHNQEGAVIAIRTGQTGDTVWFEVSDNGPGIPPEQQKKIFDPFFTTKPKADDEGEGPKGTGLGLFICAEMVRAYDGEIAVKSKVGEGTTFRVSIPKNRQAQSKGAAQANAKPAAVS